MTTTEQTTLVLNFGHPMTDDQVAQLTALLTHTPQVHNVPLQVDRQRPLAELVRDVVDSVGLTSEEWQTRPLVMNPPGLAPLALALVAELHGRCGYFLPLVHVRPVEGVVPPRFEVAEVVNVQAVREAARARR